jgi:hypothetical protein
MFTIVRFRFIVSTLFLALLLTACASIEIVSPTDTPVQPTPASATYTPIQPTPTSAASSGTTKIATYNIVTGELAKSITAETVTAVPVSNDSPYWDQLPQHVRLTLEGYPISNHLMKPQIFLYPAKDLPGWNEGAGKQVDDLRALLASRQVGEHLPQMPLFNAAQVIHAQVKFLDFKSGQGMRFVTEYDQAVLPINNHELIYTYQGLTSDGLYYVAAILPLNVAGLPDNENTQLSGKFSTDFPGYLADTVKTFNESPSSAFTPDLATLDAMMSSLEVH